MCCTWPEGKALPNSSVTVPSPEVWPESMALLHLLVGERIQARELQRAGAPDGGERLFRVGQAGDLHENLVGTLLLHRGLRGAQRVHAALDDGAGLLHVLGGDRLAVRGLRREHHRQAALNVEALVDLLVGRGEQHHRHDDEQGGEDEQPHVAAIRRTGRLLLDVAFQCHGMRPSSFAFLVSCALFLSPARSSFFLRDRAPQPPPKRRFCVNLPIVP